ncbi:death-associated protein kinase 2-like isoform X2 [Corticium candelabrum]|uniref:death-associated protein kinase 2-like isoform X2 n=1 Tax=Corticium candelabrum TaxID=121492 RepID=UPI002E267537|nr:death-associated protein kinase 2-like isoform X2 [Corticium candelabrum]
MMWRDLYDPERELGRGQFGVVIQCIDKSTRQRVAIKIISKENACKERDSTIRELEALQRARGHSRLVQLIDVFHTSTETAFVLENIQGGELFDYLANKDMFTEEEAIVFTRQLLDGLAYLHAKTVVHLDLKPENILLVNEGSVASIKIVDFGLARILKDDEVQLVKEGTPEFVGPEIVLREPVSTATDMWAVGVLTYILLSGMSPFLGETDYETLRNIITLCYDIDEDFAESEASHEAKDFVQGLLFKDPGKRMSAFECASHPWLMPHHMDRRRSSVILTKRLRLLNARRKWLRFVQVVQASSFLRGLSPRKQLKSSLSTTDLPIFKTEELHRSGSCSFSEDEDDDAITSIPVPSTTDTNLASAGRRRHGHKHATTSVSSLLFSRRDSRNIQKNMAKVHRSLYHNVSNESGVGTAATDDPMPHKCKCQTRRSSIG